MTAGICKRRRTLGLRTRESRRSAGAKVWICACNLAHACSLARSGSGVAAFASIARSACASAPSPPELGLVPIGPLSSIGHVRSAVLFHELNQPCFRSFPCLSNRGLTDTEYLRDFVIREFER